MALSGSVHRPGRALQSDVGPDAFGRGLRSLGPGLLEGLQGPKALGRAALDVGLRDRLCPVECLRRARLSRDLLGLHADVPGPPVPPRARWQTWSPWIRPRDAIFNEITTTELRPLGSGLGVDSRPLPRGPRRVAAPNALPEPGAVALGHLADAVDRRCEGPCGSLGSPAGDGHGHRAGHPGRG